MRPRLEVSSCKSSHARAALAACWFLVAWGLAAPLFANAPWPLQVHMTTWVHMGLAKTILHDYWSAPSASQGFHLCMASTEWHGTSMSCPHKGLVTMHISLQGGRDEVFTLHGIFTSWPHLRFTKTSKQQQCYSAPCNWQVQVSNYKAQSVKPQTWLAQPTFQACILHVNPGRGGGKAESSASSKLSRHFSGLGRSA